MKIKIELFELKNLLIEAAMLGAEAAEKRRSPTSDRMKQREVHRWLKTLGHKPAILDKMVKEELVKPHRNGESKNSPLVYSNGGNRSGSNSIQIFRFCKWHIKGIS